MENFHTSKASTRAIFGGNRSGKTTAGGHEFLFHVTGLYPKWYPDYNKFNGPIKGRICAKDFLKGVGEVIIPFLEDNLDDAFIRRKIRNPMGVPIKWILKNGSQFDILTYEQSTDQYEGWRGHIAWFDEPPPRDKYVATLRGLVDFNGRNWLTLTPLKEAWIYDDIYTKQDPRIFAVTVSMRDNKTLTEEAIKDYESKLTEEEKEARLYGRFLHLSGLVYKVFDPRIHICEPPRVKPHWTRYFCIDPHEHNPTACLWLAVDEKERHWVYDELWLADMNIEQMCHMIHAQEGRLPAQIRLIDPAMDKEDALASGFNPRKEFAKYGVYCQRAITDPLLGRSRVRQALKPRFNSILNTETPILRVSRLCQHTIYEFQHYVWDERRRFREELNKLEKTKKVNDHFMDCLKYIYNNQPHFIPPEDEDEGEVEWTGEYTSRPTKRHSSSRGYHDLVERQPGQF